MSTILRSWKEIANYLAVSVRSAQRWAAMYGVPVRRGSPPARRSVFAFTHELDEWLKTVPIRRDAARSPDKPLIRRLPAGVPPAILAVDDNDIHRYALSRPCKQPGFAW